MLLDFRKPKCVVLKEETSWSGKYRIFYGHHYVQGRLCFDVGAINLANGEITSRHYNETEHEGVVKAKAEALRIYDELARGMRRKPESEEGDDNVYKTDAYRRELKRGRGND